MQKRVSFLCLILFSVCFSSGCLMLAAGAGAGAVGVRELTDAAVIYQGNADAVEKTVRSALHEMGAVVTETVREEGVSSARRTLRGKTYDHEALTVDIEPSTPSSTNVEIRVGRIGDKSRAVEFHNKIQKYLKPVNPGK